MNSPIVPDPWGPVKQVFTTHYRERTIDRRTWIKAFIAVGDHDVEALLNIAAENGFREEVRSVVPQSVQPARAIVKDRRV